MTDTTLPPNGGAGDRIEPVDLGQEMQNSYIDYAMSVIVGRALPEVRDGLKPVHRRLLYASYDAGFRPDRGYVKSAKPVAETMGNYHPHGDTAIYDALVRLAQPWSMRYPLIDGQGNFGSRGNDGAAAMVLMRESTAKKLGVKPLARIVSHATHAQEPEFAAREPAVADLSDNDYGMGRELFAPFRAVAGALRDHPHREAAERQHAPVEEASRRHLERAAHVEFERLPVERPARRAPAR